MAVYQVWNPELLRETLELAGRRGPLLEIDEVSFYPALGEEAQGLSSVGTFLETKNLDFHGGNLYRFAFASSSSRDFLQRLE
jgi:hypothetical protein